MKKPALLMVGMLWLVGSIFIAANSAFVMSETLVPTAGQPAEIAAAELAGIERARRFAAEAVWMAAVVLVINSLIILTLAWRLAQSSGNSIPGLLAQVPSWIWFLLAATQALAIPGEYERIIAENKPELDYFRRGAWTMFVGTSFLLILFLGLAFWRLRMGKRSEVITTNSNAISSATSSKSP
jgi:hypothetical protein